MGGKEGNGQEVVDALGTNVSDDAEPSTATEPEEDHEPVKPAEEDLHDDSEPRVTRKQRRTDRYREAIDAAKSAEERAMRTDDEVRRLQGMLTSFLSQQAAPKKEEGPDKITELRSRQEEILRMVNTIGDKVTPDDAKKYYAMLTKIDDDIAEERAKRIEERVTSKLGQRANPLTSIAETVRVMNPDVFERPEVIRWMQGRYQMRLAKGEKDSAGLYNSLVDEARKEFRIGVKGQVVPDNERSRYTGERGAIGGGEEAGGDDIDVDDPNIRKMINAYGKHIPNENKRIEHFKRTVGRGLRQQK